MSTANFVRLIGAAACLSAYGLLLLGRVKVDDGQFVALNGIGALAILCSLVIDFNLPSFVMYST
ncbi:CBU_0592 family membrane protein [Microvirga lotononidis]|uniref:CBU_0592 family membrane protein n=1 Tax=Microvirga lotononidis TaxID=864069 RepID=UPI003CC91233